ncbi:MAG: hypothetical protein U0932_15150 [Thiobacillus sp.]|nr:hypothetical protein [Thiobacillus sp.]
MSATTLYQWVGISDSSSRNLVCGMADYLLNLTVSAFRTSKPDSKIIGQSLYAVNETRLTANDPASTARPGTAMF